MFPRPDLGRRAAGDENARRGVGRDGYVERKSLIAVDPPRAFDLAVHRFEFSARERETTAWLRADENVLVPGPCFVEIDAGDGPVHPVANRTERVVIERVHAGVAKTLVVRPRVPAFPHR